MCNYQNLYKKNKIISFMKDYKKITIFSSTLIILITLFTINIISYLFIDIEDAPFLIDFFIRYHILFMFLVTFLALIFGFISYIFMTKEVNTNKNQQEKIVQTILNLLEKEERNIIKYLIKNNGVATQYELTKIANTHKVKVHRILEKMIVNNILKKEKVGKINKIYLNREILFFNK